MSRFSKSSKKSRVTLFIFLFIILAGLIGTGVILFFEGEAPTLSLNLASNYIGAESTIVLSAQDRKSGLKDLKLTITQGNKNLELFAGTYPRSGYIGVIGAPEETKEITFNPKKAGLSNGPAVISLHGSDYSARRFLKRNQTTISQNIIIDTTPPKVSILHSERYINPGGSGIVIYRVDDKGTRNGLLINDDFHPGFDVGDGRDDTYIAYFGLPYNADDASKTFVVAEDRAGNTARVPFTVIFKNTKFRLDRINVGDGFLTKKIPEFEQYYPKMSGELIDKYLYTNNIVRQENNKKISDLCKNPHPERLWNDRFLRMPGSSRAGYADHRTYYYQSQSIDKQVHLGIDIASTKNADVKASARGIVVYADYLGIYGNMVLLDHGHGVFSLYSHLSQINVSPQDALEQGVVLGLTGTSGMAGGDHLHFSILVNGIFVTPKEWWDQHWLDVTIEEPLVDSRF
ncbi:MAG: peptidoglycan DD-metalloendopeptidase family protein [Deltaproteobacteria bacterium]|nr:peptidoglycan DD-metalloendopeptidase family protein [Deltaproteobacteria bacterium]